MSKHNIKFVLTFSQLLRNTKSIQIFSNEKNEKFKDIFPTSTFYCGPQAPKRDMNPDF